MSRAPEFPTSIHQEAADAIVDFSMSLPIQAVLAVNSCARGTAIPESDLDIALLIDPEMSASDRKLLDQAWNQRYSSEPVFRELERLSRFARVHLDVFDGRWAAEAWDDGGGPDSFEIEIGNRVAYSVALLERGRAFADLRAGWLPYYADSLREQRLRMVNDACSLNIERVHRAVRRGLTFYAFDRLYHAFQEFLQALFIAHRVYPIAYNKWIREQVEGWLGLATLYSELPSVLAVTHLHPIELIDKAEHLRLLLQTWACPSVESGMSSTSNLTNK